MKNQIYKIVLFCFLLVNTIKGFANNSIGFQTIEPLKITITTNKTTNLIFPYDIISVDKGSLEVLVQKAKGVQNILQVKAASSNMQETNLTVITSNGKLYSFLLSYFYNPSALNFSFGKRITSQASLSSGTYNEQKLNKYSKVSLGKKKQIHGIQKNRYGIKLSLNGIFIHENVMYYRITIENKSNLSYDIERLRFYIRDSKKVKRTTYQEIEVKPLYKYGNTSTVEGNSKISLVVALAKRTIPQNKHMSIQLIEEDGGRQLEVKVKNKKLLKANMLP